jgi:hypothetical protein
MRLGLALLVLATACASAPAVTDRPTIFLLPMTFEANLRTARECEFRGVVGDAEGARISGANLVLILKMESVTTTSNGVTTYRASGWTGAKAVRCPGQVIAALSSGTDQSAVIR